VDAQYPSSVGNEELHSLLTTIENQELTIQKLECEIKQLKSKPVKAKVTTK